MELSTINIALYRWLEPFLAGIRNKGFTVSPDTHIQVIKVLNGMSHKIDTPNDLYDYIAPLLAKSGEQATLLREEFDKYYFDVQEDIRTLKASIDEAKVDSKHSEKRNKLVLYILGGILVLSILFFVFHQANKAAEHGVQAKYQIQFTNIARPVIFSAAPAFNNAADTSFADFRWDFGDGNKDSSGKATISHHYAKAGVYKTSLVILDKAHKLQIESPYVVQEISLCKPQIFLDSDAGIEVTLNDSARFFPIYDASFPPGDSNVWLLNGNVIKRNASELALLFDSAGLQTVSYIDEQYADLDGCEINQADKPVYVKPATNISADIIQSGEPVTPPVKMSRTFLLLAGLVLLGSLFGYLLAWSKMVAQKKEDKAKPEDILASFKGTRPPYEIPFKNYEEIIDDEPYISKLARNLKRRMPDESSFINIPVTINETIRSEGLITPYYSFHTRPIEYLVLIDRTKANNQQVKLFEYLLKRFIKTDLFIEIFYYSGDPGICVNDKYAGGIKLSRLFDIYSRHILIVFGDGKPFIKKSYPALEENLAALIGKWEDRALLTPKPFVDWDYKEALLQELFEVLPADLEGQLLLFSKQEGLEDNFQEYAHRLKHSYSLQPYDFEDVSELETYLGDPFLFQWLCALAVYSSLNWSVILAIGDALQKENYPKRSINYTQLLKLVRIPWMAEGSMPDDTRLDLLKKLQPTNELVARQTMIKMMDEATARLDENSFVYEKLEMQRITDKFMLYAQNPDNPDHSNFNKAYAAFKLLWKADLIPDYPLSEYLKKAESEKWSTLVGNRMLSAEPNQSEAIDSYLEDSIPVQKRHWNAWRKAAMFVAMLMLSLFIGLSVFRTEVNSTAIDRALRLTEKSEDFDVPVSFGYIASECFSGLKAGKDSSELILSMGENWSVILPANDTVINTTVPYSAYKPGNARIVVQSSDPQYLVDTSFSFTGDKVRVQYVGCPVICNNWQLLVNNSVPEAARGRWYAGGILVGTGDVYRSFQITSGQINGEAVEQVYRCASDPKMFKLICNNGSRRFKAYIINERTDPQKLGIAFHDQSFSSKEEANRFASKVQDLTSVVNIEKAGWQVANEAQFVNDVKGKWNRDSATGFELENELVIVQGVKGKLVNPNIKTINERHIYKAVFVAGQPGYGNADSTIMYFIPIDTNRLLISNIGSASAATNSTTSPTPKRQEGFYAYTRSVPVVDEFKTAKLPVSLNDIWVGSNNRKRLVNISLTKQRLYYSTGDESTYGTYPTSNVTITPGGVYKIVSVVNGESNVFFIKNVTATGFEMSICQQLKGMTASQVRQMDETGCGRFDKMRLYYPSNTDRIYLPNNSRSLTSSERKKLANYSKLLSSGNYQFRAYVNNDYLNNIDIDAVCRMLADLQKQKGNIINSFRVRNNPFGRSYVEITALSNSNNNDYNQHQQSNSQDDGYILPPDKKYLYKNQTQFKDMLDEVCNGKKQLADFDIYLCDGAKTKVVENGNVTTFGELFKNLYGKKRKIESVNYIDVTKFNDKSRCIQSLKVDHKKPGLF